MRPFPFGERNAQSGRCKRGTKASHTEMGNVGHGRRLGSSQGVPSTSSAGKGVRGGEGRDFVRLEKTTGSRKARRTDGSKRLRGSEKNAGRPGGGRKIQRGWGKGSRGFLWTGGAPVLFKLADTMINKGAGPSLDWQTQKGHLGFC